MHRPNEPKEIGGCVGVNGNGIWIVNNKFVFTVKVDIYHQCLALFLSFFEIWIAPARSRLDMRWEYLLSRKWMKIFVFISCFSFFLSQDVSQGCQCEAPAAAFGWWEQWEQWEQSVCGPTVVLKLRNVGLLSEGGRPSWLYHQLQQVASPQGDGGGRKRQEECLTNIGTFWQSFP